MVRSDSLMGRIRKAHDSLARDPLLPRFARWWRGAGLGQRTGIVLLLLGAALVTASVVPEGYDRAWLRDLLMTLGASLALFAPFYLVTRAIDRDLRTVAADARRETAEVRVEGARQVAELRTDVTRQLSEFAARVDVALADERERDQSAFADLGITEPARESLVEALSRAHDRGLIDPDRPPRVTVGEERDIYVSFAGGAPGEDSLRLRVEEADGTVRQEVDWTPSRDAADVTIELGRAVERHSPRQLGVRELFAGLADLLEAAASHHERRPAVELCPPQWMVCTWGVCSYNGRLYTVPIHRMQGTTEVESHVGSKPWVDEESWATAYVAAVTLWPRPGIFGADGNPLPDAQFERRDD